MDWERPYEYYFFERLAELLCLRDGVWNVDRRSQLSAACRSEYIDRLASAISAGEMGDYDAGVMRHTLDINEYLYNKAAVDEPEMWFAHLENIEQQKRYEQQVLADEIAIIRRDAVTVDARTLTSVMKRVATHLELEFSSSSGPQRLVLSSSFANGGRIEMVIEDILNLRKRGQLIPYYEMTVPLENDVYKAVLLYNNALPGGRWYGWKNMCWDSIILGLLAFCSVLQHARTVSNRNGAL
ncbi:hypothetical protein DPH57_07940 [Massilia sp. YMA4]|nr:hypothetical protein DPH57_07940 [Massilia sp. YMA4]